MRLLLAAVPTTPAPLFENAAGQLLADPAGLLRLVWSSQPRQLADTQALFGAVGQALRQRGWGRMLANQTQMPPLTPAEQQWLSQEWLPGEGRRSGYRSIAIVVSHNVLGRLATAAVTTVQPEGGPRYRSFDDEAAALAWLLRQPV